MRYFTVGVLTGMLMTGVSAWAFQSSPAESPGQAMERMQQGRERVEQQNFRSQQWLENQSRRNGPC